MGQTCPSCWGTDAVDQEEFQPTVPGEAEQPEKPPSLLGQLRGRDTKAAKAELAGEKPPACREALNEIPQQVLDDTLSSKVLGHIRGDKQWQSSPLQPAPAFASQKGNKDLGYDTPNQDNFSVTRFRNGFTLACVADGHGRYGHVASTRAVQAIPFLLHTEGGFDKESLDEERVEELLVSAFEKANSDIIALLRSGRTGKDVRTSGTTVVAALWKGATLWAANLGDSRLIVGTQVDEKLLLETQDHKPEKSEERARIERMGGEVRAPVYSDGSISVPRVFLPGQGSPGLAISRTLGDQTAKGIGVIPTPEVSKMTLEGSKKPFLVLATDGVWELLDSRLVAAEIARALLTSSADQAVRLLQAEAWTAWKEDSGVFDPDEEDFYCDDMTSLLIQLS